MAKGYALISDDGQVSPLVCPTAVILQNNQTQNYILEISDLSKLITCTKATQFVLGIPPNLTVAFPIGSTMKFLQGGVGRVVFAAVAPAILLTPGGRNRTAEQFAVCDLIKVATDIWVLYGNISL